MASLRFGPTGAIATAQQVADLVGDGNLNLRKELIFGSKQVENEPLPWNIELDPGIIRLFTIVTGNGDVQSMTRSTDGRVVLFQSVFGGVKTFKHNFSTPPVGYVPFTCPNGRDFTVGPREDLLLVSDDTSWLVFPFGTSRPGDLAPLADNIGVPFEFRVSCPSGGSAGTPDDVVIYNANAPLSFRITDCWFTCAAAVVGSTVQLRTASGGGGTALSSALSTAATGTSRNNDTATRTVAQGGTVVIRRSDRSVAGDMMISAVRT